MNGFSPQSLAAMPGDDLLFQRLSVSTIGAVRFHGRVRDGIGWVTDAMATKQWSRRVLAGLIDVRVIENVGQSGCTIVRTNASCSPGLTLMAGFYKREQSD